MSTLATLFPKARTEVLRLLFDGEGRELHLREIARLAGLTVAALSKELSLLAEDGLVVSRRDGNRLYFRADPAHPVYPELRKMVEKTSGLPGQLKKTLAPVDGIRCAFIFGSMAAGTAHARSDVDLLVIGSVGLRKISPALRGIADSLEREINPRCMTVDEWAQKLAARDAFVLRVAAEPKLWLKGGPDELAALGE